MDGQRLWTEIFVVPFKIPKGVKILSKDLGILQTTQKILKQRVGAEEMTQQ